MKCKHPCTIVLSKLMYEEFKAIYMYIDAHIKQNYKRTTQLFWQLHGQKPNIPRK